MSVISSPALFMGEDGYQISRSVRLRSSASAYFNRTSASSVTSNTTWTYSFWLKIGSQSTSGALLEASSSGSTGIPRGGIRWGGSNDLELFQYNGSTYDYRQITTQVFRDPSAWYHIVVVADTSNGTAANRMKLYVNNVQVTSWSTNTQPSSSLATYVGSASKLQRIGVDTYTGSSEVFDGYLTEINFIDGQALTPSSFGENDSITGVWNPKKYAGTYGTNGFYLNFSDNSNNTAATIGKDSSGNGNNWTPNNISVTTGSTYDSMLDTPTPYADGGNGRGNYAVLNPLTNGSYTTLSGGNLNTSGNTSANNGNSRSSFAFSSGKWYMEFTVNGLYATGYPQYGIVTTADANTPNSGAPQAGYSTSSVNPTASVIYLPSGNKQTNNSSTSYGSSFTTGNVIGIAVDSTNGAVYFSKDGVWQNSGDPTSGATKTGAALTWTGGAYEHVISVAEYNGSGSSANFGQRPFAYTPPTGFKALNTQNLPDSTIKKGSTSFDVQTWSGNGVNGRTITSTVDAVDLAWVKRRDSADDHRLANSVLGGNKHLKSNATDAESTGTTIIQAFSGNTFTIGSDGSVNASGGTYVGWVWKKGATPGFDIVTFNSGAAGNKTQAHSLGVAPSMIITKNRDAVASWAVWHKSFATPSQGYLLLNGTGSVTNDSRQWANTAPTSSVFSYESGYTFGANNNCLAYLFAEVAGFSKFGSYTGNGSADGPFVYCGFRPRWVMWKLSSGAGQHWQIMDTARDAYNPEAAELFANLSNAEQNAVTNNRPIDITANGFKVRGTDPNINTSTATYIFAAFAEVPFKAALAR